jgi:hypothetical protein
MNEDSQLQTNAGICSLRCPVAFVQVGIDAPYSRQLKRKIARRGSRLWQCRELT